MDMQMYITSAHESVNDNADAYVNAYASAYEICEYLQCKCRYIYICRHRCRCNSNINLKARIK
jgi:hypothetical protein